MKKVLLILLGFFPAIGGCQSMHHRLGMMSEEGGGGTESNSCDMIWFESFVEAVDNAKDFSEIQEVLDQGVSGEKNYLKQCIAWDDDTYTPLHYAAEKGDLEIVQELIEERAIPVNIQTGICGRTPLHLAALKGRLNVVQFLLESDQVILEQEDSQGSTALHYAASGVQGEKNIEVVKLLIEKGAQYGKLAGDFSLLDCAVNADNAALVGYLIAKFAFFRDENCLQKSLEIANYLNKKEISRILEKHLKSDKSCCTGIFSDSCNIGA
jgi:ankyrin repeat protein